MAEDIAKKSSSINVGCTSWAGAFLTAVIIAIRAFQPNAAPMETWSIGSWFLMALPLVLPIALWICIGIFSVLCIMLSAMFDK